MAKQDLHDFINSLASDAALRRRFKENPDAVMSDAGLSAEESALVKSGDESGIRTYLGDPAAGLMIEGSE